MSKLKKGAKCGVFYKTYDKEKIMEFVSREKIFQKHYSPRYKGKRNQFKYQYKFIYEGRIIKTEGYSFILNKL